MDAITEMTAIQRLHLINTRQLWEAQQFLQRSGGDQLRLRHRITKQAILNVACGINRVPMATASTLRRLHGEGRLGSTYVSGSAAMWAYESVAGVNIDQGLVPADEIELSEVEQCHPVLHTVAVATDGLPVPISCVDPRDFIDGCVDRPRADVITVILERYLVDWLAVGQSLSKAPFPPTTPVRDTYPYPPAAIILLAWRQLEAQLRRLSDPQHPPDERGFWSPPRRIETEARQLGLNDDELAALMELQKLRNQVAHSVDAPVTYDEAVRFKEVVERLLARVRKS
jgi:hypothetical protein